MARNKCSVISEIERAEAAIKESFYRVEVLEKNLKSRYISIEERERLEKELAEVRSILSKNEAELKTLHKENSKSFVVAVMLMFFAFLIYGLYVMFTNPVER